MAPAAPPAEPAKKHTYKMGKQRYYSREDWVEIFKALDTRASILSVSRKTGIRRQIISQKYKQWKEMGDAYYGCSLWSNKVFTNEEEQQLINIMLNLPKQAIKGQLFSDATIARIAMEFYEQVKMTRKIKRFKASQSWIIDFRQRNGFRIVESKCFYYQWEVLRS